MSQEAARLSRIVRAATRDIYRDVERLRRLTAQLEEAVKDNLDEEVHRNANGHEAVEEHAQA